MPLEFSALIDEARIGLPTFQEQAQFAASDLGLGAIDGRGFDFATANGGVERINVINLTPAQAREVKQILDGNGLKMPGLGLPTGKSLFADKANFFKDTEPNVDLVPGYIRDKLDPFAEILEILGNPATRIFGGERAETTALDNKIIEAIARVTQALIERGARAVELEHEPSTGIADPADFIEVRRQISNPKLKFVFDPGNAFLVGYKDDVTRLLGIVTEVFDRLGCVHYKFLDPNDPGIKPNRAWTAENNVTKFTIAGGPEFEGLMKLVKQLLEQEEIIRAVLEPHLDHSDRSFGLTGPDNYRKALYAAAGGALRHGIDTDIAWTSMGSARR